MGKKLYVGNLSYSTTEDDLRALFEEHGAIESCTIIKDRFSGESKGFGFVQYATAEEAQRAIQAVNGREVGGRALRVDEAQEQQPRRGGGGGGRGGGGGGGGRGGFGGGGGRGGGGGGGGRGRF